MNTRFPSTIIAAPTFLSVKPKVRSGSKNGQTVLSLFFLAGLFIAIFGGSATGQTNNLSAVQRDETLRRYGLDPNSSLESRVQSVVLPEVPKQFQQSQTLPTLHVLTSDERIKVSAALAALPPVHRRILTEHLRSISFLEGISTSAVTWTINKGASYPVYDIAFRKAILHQTASEWLTEKERSVFSVADSPLTVSIEAGDRDALSFLLLHEATHAADFTIHITSLSPEQMARGISNTTILTVDPFIKGVWNGPRPAPAYRYPLREQIHFYTNDDKLAIEQAEAVYQSLRTTPFVSLYGGLNSGDDLAEYLAVYHWTNVLKQPYRIVVRSEGKSVFEYEPMGSEGSDLVLGRVSLMKRFYEDERN